VAFSGLFLFQICEKSDKNKTNKNPTSNQKETKGLNVFMGNCEIVQLRTSFRSKRWLGVKKMCIYHFI